MSSLTSLAAAHNNAAWCDAVDDRVARPDRDPAAAGSRGGKRLGGGGVGAGIGGGVGGGLRQDPNSALIGVVQSDRRACSRFQVPIRIGERRTPSAKRERAGVGDAWCQVGLLVAGKAYRTAI